VSDRRDPNDEWFAEWFGEEYLTLYGHRDDDEAREAVDLVVAHAGVGPGEPVLDLACGAGRHVARLREAGLRAFGLDLSAVLLRVTRAQGLPCVRADMRALPFAPGSLGMVTSFFTSFGYFDDPDDDGRVLAEVARVLRPGGVLAVDYLNADAVRADLRPRTEEDAAGRRVVQTRTLADGGTVVEKRIEIHEGEGAPRTFLERVRLYDADELRALLAAHGIETVRTFGDYSGGPPSPAAPRVILIGRLR
jgi:SAM-dependent methyltransferase